MAYLLHDLNNPCMPGGVPGGGVILTLYRCCGNTNCFRSMSY